MTDLLKIIKAGTKNKTIINFPGTDKKVELRLLSNQDTLDATADSEKLFKHLGIVPEFYNINSWENERAIQMLYRALHNPEDGSPISPDIASFRNMTTNEERRDLIDAYDALTAECNPSPDVLSSEEFDALIESVKKNPETTIGSCSNLQTLRRLALFLAKLLASSRTDNGPISS